MSVPSLILRDLQAANLRCHRSVRWQCGPGLNMVTGENGSGKTTLLEAVFLMGHGRSFRQARDPALVRWGNDGFSLSSRWMRYGPLHVEVAGGKNGTQVRLQGRSFKRRAELAEMLPVLVESPQGARLVDGVPGERRRWLDQMTLYCRPELGHDYHAYLRCLMQWGRLLRRNGASQELEAWEHQMVAHGLGIMRMRMCILDDLNGELAAEKDLTEASLRVSIQVSAPETETGWLERLAQHRRRGRRHGILRLGPHCDRLVIGCGNRDIRTCGSRGQQKLAAVALRLAERRLRMQHRGLVPILLLDDCLESLDPVRQQRLLDHLAGQPGQVLMTGPPGMRLPGKLEIDCYELSIRNHGTQMLMPAASGVEEAA